MELQILLRRLHKAQLALFGVIGVAVGLGLLILSHVDAIERLPLLPVKDIGNGLFTTGLFATVVEYLLSRDTEQRIRDSVINGFAVDPDTLNRITSPATRERIIENSLTAQLGDQDLAREVYADLRDQVIRVRERHYDTHVSVTFTPWEDGPTSGAGAMFVATVRWEYRITTPPGVRRFACVSDAGDYNRILRDPTSAGVWQFTPTAGLDAGSPDVFHLDQYTINGIPRAIQHTRDDRAQLFTIDGSNINSVESGEWVISYTYRALAPQHSQLLYLNVDKPSKGIRAEFTHHDCDIHHASVIDFLSSAHDPRIHHSPQAAPISTITISHDGWIFPKAGLTYTWTLNPGQS